MSVVTIKDVQVILTQPLNQRLVGCQNYLL